jgi:prepilin-type N-terminal cleavage/methylation domain-containing protein
MERTSTQFQHCHFRAVGGFTLIELLVGLAITGILVIALWTLMETQNRTYGFQDSSGEMQQNLRVAVERLSRDLMRAGRGPQWSNINGNDLSAWYNAVNNWIPYRISTTVDPVTGVTTAVTVDVIGCIDGTAGSLSAQANSGDTTITLQAGEADSFNNETRREISIGGVENARVRNVDGNQLSVSTNPDPDPLLAAQALQSSHHAETDVCQVQWVTYQWNGNVLTVNEHLGNGAQEIVRNITSMAVNDSPIDWRQLTIRLTGTTTGTNTPIASTVTNTIVLRN